MANRAYILFGVTVAKIDIQADAHRFCQIDDVIIAIFQISEKNFRLPTLHFAFEMADEEARRQFLELLRHHGLMNIRHAPAAGSNDEVLAFERSVWC